MLLAAAAAPPLTRGGDDSSGATRAVPLGPSPAVLLVDSCGVIVVGDRSYAPLRIVAQPEAEFFKDEGGKQSCLSVTVEAPASHIAAPVQLRATLYFENGVRVNEADQRILNLMAPNGEAPVLTPSARRATITYRIEKVSRRSDNHRFRVYVEPVYTEGSIDLPAACLRGILSGPTCVMSKRKTGERMVSVKTGEGVFFTKSEVKPRPLAAAEVAEMFASMSREIAALRGSLTAAEAMLVAHGRRLARVEAGARDGGATALGGDRAACLSPLGLALDLSPSPPPPLGARDTSRDVAMGGAGSTEAAMLSESEAASEIADDLSFLSEILGERTSNPESALSRLSPSRGDSGGDASSTSGGDGGRSWDSHGCEGGGRERAGLGKKRLRHSDRSSGGGGGGTAKEGVRKSARLALHAQ